MDLNEKYTAGEIYNFAALRDLFVTDCTSRTALDPLDEESLPEITLSDDMEGDPIYQFVYEDGWDSFDTEIRPLFTLLYINQ